MKTISADKVLSLGAVAMDVVLNSTGLPENDGFSLVSDEVLVPGGSASNMSVALHRLGVPVEQAGKIGDDHYGVSFRRNLAENGVGVEHLAVRPGGTTLHTYIVTAPGGQHSIFANKGNCVFELRREELREGILDGCGCFYTDLFSADAALYLAGKAGERGIPVVYNMQCALGFMEVCGVGRGQIDEMLHAATLLVGGKGGFDELCGKTDPEEKARAVYEQYHPADGVICTCGSRGAVWYSEEGLVRMPAFSVDVADSTGAGDSFCAGLIFARYCRRDGSREQALRFASAVAALKCRTAGPRSTATLADVERFLQEG